MSQLTRVMAAAGLAATIAAPAGATDARAYVVQFSPQGSHIVDVPQVAPFLRRSLAQSQSQQVAQAAADVQASAQAAEQAQQAGDTETALAIFDLDARSYSRSEFRLPSVRFGVMTNDRF